MGFAPPDGVAGQATASIAILPLDLHNAMQDNAPGMKKKNPNAQALGSLGGQARAKNLSAAAISEISSKGGKARASKLSAAERRRIAKLAVAARERKRKGKS
jgi:hypothetical protein